MDQTHIEGNDISFLQEDRKDAAEIQQAEAQTIKTLTDAGYKAESVIAAVLSGDFSQLVHTGLFSVQLQPPGTKLPTNGSVPQQAAAALANLLNR